MCDLCPYGSSQPVPLALRYSFRGVHSGFGHFGEPTGAPAHVMGMGHAHIVAGRVAQKWILADQVSTWKRILAHGG